MFLKLKRFTLKIKLWYNLSMSRVLIFGNVTKDVYLNLNENDGEFETDKHGVEWMNLGFNGEDHNFFSRTSVFGGAAITLEVFEKFRIDAKIAGVEFGNRSAKTDYRYILRREDGIAYFSPEVKNSTRFVEPDSDTTAIIIDRSANISTEFVKKLLDFMQENPKTLLVVYAPKKIHEHEKRLIEAAKIVFADEELPKNVSNDFVFYFEKDKIRFGEVQQTWELRRPDLMTHLTIYSIAMASIVGSAFRKRKLREALLFAKVNVENSSLNGTLPFERILSVAETERREASDLRMTAKTLVEFPKGILAADESGGSIHKKFESMQIPDDEAHRRDYRNIFFTTKDLEKYVNGVILFDETARQKADDGRNFVDFLTARGIIPGIKVDQGLVNFTNSEEKYTKGLEGLRSRLNEYYKMGLRFAKWRAAFEISETTPSDFAIQRNCEILAQYASDCQAEKIVPIVEPEVVYDGNYPLLKNFDTTSRILSKLFECLEEKHIELSGTILKVNMVLAGKQFPVQSTPEEVGKATAEVLRKYVPKELAGVVFLSGGQSVEQATENLQAVTNEGPFPWPVTFSFARALQDPALFAWKGDNNNSDAAREGFYQRLVENCEALRKK